MTNIQNIGDKQCFKMFYEWYKISSQSWKYSENRKKEAISISVFGYKNKKKYPIYVSKNILKKNMFIYY